MERKSCCSSGRSYVTSTCGTTPKKETVTTTATTTTTTVKKEAAATAANMVKPSDMADCGSTRVVDCPKTEEEKKPCVSVKKEEPVKVNVVCGATCGFKPTEG